MKGQGICRFSIHPGYAAIGALLLGAMSSFPQTYIDFSSKPNVYRGLKTNVAASKIEGHTAPRYLAAAVTVFSDDFNNSTLDLNKWRLGSNAGNQTAVVNNALQLRTQDAVYQSGWAVTRNAYPARNTTVAVKVIQPNNDGDLGISPTYNVSSIYGIYNESNFYRFYTYRNTSSGPYLLYVEWKKNGVLNGFDVTGNLVINGAVYLRLRCDDTKIHFDASLDGVTWTDTYNETFDLPGYTLDTPFYYELAGYKTWSNGTLTVDDFSITSQSTDAQPPQISAVAAQNITGSSAQITWQTDEAADSQVEYGLTTSYGATTPLDGNLVTSHSVQLSSLVGNTIYHYRVKSKDAAGNLAVSGDFVFQTSIPGNNVTVLQDALNTITLGSRTGGQFVNGGGWQVTGVNDLIVYDLGRYVESGACEVQVRNFSPGAQNTHYRHHFFSMFRNPWGNHHPVENQETVWDLHAGFNYDPGVKMLSWTYEATEVDTRVFDPWNLSQTYQIKVTWDGNQLQYFRDGVLYATHTHTDAMQLRYLYIGRDLTVSADLITDFQNNQYPAIVGPIYSNVIVTENVSATDQSPPQLGNIAASDIYVNGARLTWTASEPAVCYVEYGPSSSYGQQTPVLGPPAQTFATTLANLASNQTYHYRIVALDNAGNLGTTTDHTFMTSESGTYVFKPVADTYVEQAGLYGTTRDYGNFGWMNLLGGAGRESYLRFNVTGVNGDVTQCALRLHGRQSGNSGGTLRVLTASWNENAVTWRTKPNVTGQQLGAINSVQAGQWHEVNTGTVISGNGTYNFALVGTGSNLVSFDSRESTNAQPELIVATAALDITPPEISGVVANAITASSTTINWTTNEAADSQVEYGLTTSYGSLSPLDASLMTSHAVALSSLQANTTYHYRVRSKDAAGNLAMSGDFTFATSPPPPSTSVLLYTPFEVRLSTATAYNNPYRDISVTGVFTSPSGKQLSLAGFWDGGQIWKVRFSPNETGTWSYSTQSADPGLATSGTFQAVSSNPAKRGFVRTSAAKPYQFEYSDGTPFLLMGDTNWDGMSSGVGFETRFKPYIDLRVSQKFNAYHTILVHNRYDYQSNEGGAPFAMISPDTRNYDVLNPGFFQWVDRRVAYADSSGMVSILFFTWAYELRNMSADQYQRLALYIVSRYAAYNVFWVLAGDYQSYFYEPTLYRSVGNAVAAADPFDHPISLHASDSFTNREFGNDDWLSYIMHQLRDAGEFLADSVRDTRTFNKPVVNGEYGYHVPASVHPSHGIRQDADYTRTGGWSIFAAGGYFVAGFHHTFYDPDGHYPYDPGFDLPPTYWDLNDQADLEAARQYSVFYSFFNDQTSWWELEPHREWVLDGESELLAKPNAEYVAYNARGGRMRLQLPAGQFFSLAWFDPIAGVLQPARIFASTGETVLLMPSSASDAAALIRPASAPALTTLGDVVGLQRTQLNIREVRFTWQTPDPTDSRIDLQKPDGTRIQFVDNWETTTHDLVVDGLSPNVNYTVTIASQTADGREWKSPPQNFFTTVQVMDEWIEAESMPTKTVGHAEPPGWNLDANGYLAISRNFPQTGPSRFVIRSRGEYRNAWPKLSFQLDNNELTALSINSAVFKEFALVADVTAGTHQVKIAFTNAGEERQLIVDWLHVQFNGATDTQPPNISNVATGNITTSSATITWTTNEASDSQVEYGLTTSYGSSSSLNASLVISHTMTLSSLQANTTYHYRVKSKDAAGNLATSSDFTFTTLQNDVTPPVISNVAASNISTSSATIDWTTNESSDSQVEYGLTTSYGLSSPLDTTLVTSHAVTLSSLQANTTYHYRVKSKDAAGNLATSSDFTFTTSLQVLPVISSFTPTSGSVGTQVTIAGSNFTGTTSVTFNGTSAPGFTVVSASQIQVNVPAGATTGQISVTTAAGTATSADDFAVVTASTLTFDPTDDAYVQSSSPTSNYGTSSQLRVRRSSSTQQNTYLKFNISGLSGNVQSVKLRLYVINDGSDGGDIYNVSNNYSGTNTPWLESDLTWNNAPAINGSSLASAGAVIVGQTVELDVTAAISGNGVYSFAISNNSSNRVYYQSKESSNPPVLVIQPGTGSGSGNIPPTAKANGPYSGTAGVAVNFSSTGSNDSDGSITGYLWNFGDGNTSDQASTSHVYAAAGAYNVTLTVTDNQGAEDTDATTATITSGGGSTWQVITYDNFESGMGSYTEGGGDMSRYTGGTYAHQGNAAADIQDNSGVSSSFYHTASYDVSNYNTLEVEFWYKMVDLETDEDFWVQYFDGSAWQTVATFARAGSIQNDVFYHEVVTISRSAYNFPTDARLRFICDASSNSDDVYIDEIEFRGATGGTLAKSNENVSSRATETLPESFELKQNYPNPFNPSTAITFSLPNESEVFLMIYNLSGSLIKTLVKDNMQAGNYTLVWDGRNDNGAKVSSGVYIYRLVSGSFVQTRRMVMLK